MNMKPGSKTLGNYAQGVSRAGISSSSVNASDAAQKNQPLFTVPSNKYNQHQRNVAGPSTSSANFNEMKRSLSNASANIATTSRQKIVATTTAQSVPLKERPSASLRILTCPIRKMIQLQKSYPNLSVLYEVFASVIKFNEGTHSKEVVVVLRNDGAGPLLRGLFYDTDFQLTGDIQVGSFVRCVGRFSAPARFQMFKISRVQQQDCAEMIQRLEALTNFELQNFLGKQYLKHI